MSFAVLFWSYRNEQTPLERNRERYHQGLQSFYEQTVKLKEAIDELDGSEAMVMALRDQFAATRFSFKRIEYILDYLQPQDVKDYLNGAPLLKTERSVPRVVVLEPKGMQVMEELIYADDIQQHKSHLRKLSKELESQTLLIQRYQRNRPIYDRQIFEAVRLGLIRIMSLGMTGFDTPGSGMALEENKLAFEALYGAVRPYLAQARNSELSVFVNNRFSEGKDWLREQDDFESFDHAFFIREFIDPLYGAVKDLQKDLYVETMDEVLLGETVFNYDADHIFDDDFLNPYYYTALHRELDSPELRELGELLFFDPILSADLKRSCASCHNPQKAFSDGQPKSIAFQEKGTVDRNAPGLINAIYSEKFFYDLRADKMENQVEHVIFNEKEFHTNYKTIFNRLEQSEEYVTRFNQAFSGHKAAGINRYTLSAAISSYILSLRSFNTPLDRYLRGEKAELEPEVKKGFNLFMGKAACATCHFAPTFTGLVPPFFEENESEVLGVLGKPDSDSLDPDEGRFASGRLADEADFYKQSFKTLTIRNVALTAPYFHNGAYTDLREVVEFYNHGGAAGRGINLPNQTLPPDSLGLSEVEISSLVRFMKSMTDTAGLGARPRKLPQFAVPEWNVRVVGGAY